ncbi:hypothetical protein H0H81_008073, partial [Sphagnurus paluster]
MLAVCALVAFVAFIWILARVAVGLEVVANDRRPSTPPIPIPPPRRQSAPRRPNGEEHRHNPGPRNRPAQRPDTPNRRNDNQGRRQPAWMGLPENQLHCRFDQLASCVFVVERMPGPIHVHVRTKRHVDCEIPPPYVPDDITLVGDDEPVANQHGHLWEPLPFNITDWVVPE